MCNCGSLDKQSVWLHCKNYVEKTFPTFDSSFGDLSCSCDDLCELVKSELIDSFIDSLITFGFLCEHIGNKVRHDLYKHFNLFQD